MTIKNYIQKYIVLKISSGDWKPGQKIMSENKMALKFDCSRLTARHAMEQLVYSGILNTLKGSGYLVTNNSKLSYFAPFSQHIGSNNSKNKVIENEKLIRNLLGISQSEKVYLFEKKYLKNNEVLSIQITAINIGIILIKNYKIFNGSITLALANCGTAIKKTEFSIKIGKNSYFNTYLKELNWDKEYPVENITSYSESGWIEKSMRVTKKAYFDISFTKFKY